MHLRAGAGSDRGRVRTLNEDAYMLRAGDGLFLVCDGMGGAPAGEVASQMAVDAIERQLHAAPAASEADLKNYLPHTRRLAAAVRWSNAFIYDHARRDPRQSGMGTTVVACLVVDNKRARDTEAAAMNMQLQRLRYGRTAGASVVAGAANDLRSWKQP